MRTEGRLKLLTEMGMTNKALCISSASRIGSKTAISDEAYAALREPIADAGLPALLELERAIGLRAMEAIRCRDRLAIWEQQLSEGQAEVVIGTKGGRPRLTHLRRSSTGTRCGA